MSRTVLHKIPVEIWLLVVPQLLFLTFILLNGRVSLDSFFSSIEGGKYGYYLLFVPEHVAPTFFYLLLYASARSLYVIWRWLGHYFTTTHTQRTHLRKTYLTTTWQYTHSVLLVTFVLTIASIMLYAAQLFIGTANPERILQTSIMLLDWDISIFGAALPFWIQGHDWSLLADQIFLTAYLLLVPIITLTFLGLLAIRYSRHIRMFILSFMLAPTIAIPVWYAIPAVTPNELYRENEFRLTIHTPLEHYAATQSTLIGPYTRNLLTKVDATQSAPERGHYHVPTFPSMHIAWGTILVYFGFIIGRPVGMIFTVWWILNAGGAVMSLQHYGVDIFSGAAIGIIALWIAHRALTYESEKLDVSHTHFSALDVLRTDLQRIQQKNTTIRKQALPVIPKDK